MAKVKNPLCTICKMDIDLEELSMLEQAEALEGTYIHPECRVEPMSQEKKDKLTEAGWTIGTSEDLFS